jgi:hypothetical protein
MSTKQNPAAAEASDKTRAAEISAAHRLQIIAVLCVGIIAMLLIGGAVTVTLLRPNQAGLVWPTVGALITTIVGQLIWWSARRGNSRHGR